MPRKRLIKEDNCIKCQRLFTEGLKMHAKNMCAYCYYSDLRGYNQKPKEKHEACKICGGKVGDTNIKGKIIYSITKGYCKLHYHQFYTKNACKTCQKCGLEFKHAKLSCLCTMCKPQPSRQAKKPREFKNGKLVRRKDLKVEDLQMMLTLFRRYKMGTQTAVDHFRVADLFLTIFENHPFTYNSMLDSYNEESQVVLMLRQLKMVYDNV